MPPSTIQVEIKRHSTPDQPAVTEKFSIPYRPGMNITSLLGEIALNPVTVDVFPSLLERLRLPPRSMRSGTS